jgi:acyl-CoA dehydrogenase
MSLILVAITGWILAYFRAGLRLWTAVAALGLALWSFTTPAGTAAVALLWAIALPLAMLFNLPPLRRVTLTRLVLRIFRKILPPLSSTELEALESGTVGWDGQLFSGNPDWQKLFSTPAPRLTPAELEFLAGPVEELCRMLDDRRIVEEERDLPAPVWQFLKEKRFFGMIIPPEYGGLGFSSQAHSLVIMKIASRSYTAAVTTMVPNSVGPAELLLRYGTRAQKEQYLPLLASGDEIPCFALTGPEAGSDAAAIPDRGVVCRGLFQGREIVGVRLDWEKRYITLAPVATLLGLAFKLSDPERLLGDRLEYGITLALIPAATPGISIGTRHMTLDLPLQNGPTWGRQVFIPLEWIVGGVERAGQGWRMLMECLGVGRSISLPALSTGAAKLACRATGAYARIRRQFRLPIGRMEGVEEPLARMAGLTYQMEAARAMTSAAVDRGERSSVLSAIVKQSLTERLRMVVNDAMDVQGGSAICLGPRNLLGRLYQTVPIGITVEGANILTRTLIIFGQGAVRCHPYALSEIRAAADPDRDSALRRLDQAFFGHVGFTLSTLARALWLGLTNGRLLPVPGGPCRRLLQITSRLDAAFVLAADVSMIMIGSQLKRKGKISGRLADILANLFLVSAVIKQYRQAGCPAGEWPLVEWACASSFQSIERAFRGLFNNYPNRPVAWLLRLIAFPFGLSEAGPSDSLGRQVAAILLTPSSLRDRLTAGIFIPTDTGEALGRLDDALARVIQAEPLEQRLQDAVRDKRIREGDPAELLEGGLLAGVITAGEARLLEESRAARREVIRVDDFPPESWQRGGES